MQGCLARGTDAGKMKVGVRGGVNRFGVGTEESEDPGAPRPACDPAPGEGNGGTTPRDLRFLCPSCISSHQSPSPSPQETLGSPERPRAQQPWPRLLHYPQLLPGSKRTPGRQHPTIHASDPICQGQNDPSAFTDHGPLQAGLRNPLSGGFQSTDWLLILQGHGAGLSPCSTSRGPALLVSSGPGLPLL